MLLKSDIMLNSPDADGSQMILVCYDDPDALNDIPALIQSHLTLKVWREHASDFHW